MDISQDDLYEWLSGVTLVAHRRYQARDLKGLTAVLRRLRAMRARATQDPQLATLETATAQCVLMMAELQADELRFDECIELCQCAKDILDDKAARFKAAGRQPRPDSTTWCRLVTVLGDAKWKGPDEHRDAVLTPTEMVEVYYRVEHGIRERLAKHPRSLKDTRDHEESLMWCGVAVLRAVMRFAAEEGQQLRSAIAGWHGNILDDENHPAFWDVRITRLYVMGCSDKARYSQCYRSARQALLQLKAASFDPTAQDRCAANELPYLLTRAGTEGDR